MEEVISLLSLYMQQVLGLSAVKTGLGYLAIALTAVVASGASQALVTRVGVKPVLSIGLILLGAGLYLFTHVSVDGSYWSDLFGPFVLTGIGLGFSFVPISIAALGGVAPAEAGLASGLINTTQQVGGALGLAILTTASTTRANHLLHSHHSRPYALTHGFILGFWVALGVIALSLAVTFVVLKRADLRVEPEAAPVAPA